MNPGAPRPPSRFIRGRSRGGGYRPYFYFRRNGRTIPAGGRNGQNDDVPLQNTSTTSRGGNRPIVSGGRARRTANALPTQPISASFLRPDNYAAPEEALRVNSIIVENPAECPGWCLYFLRDKYDESSQLVKCVKALEAHYNRQPVKYDLMSISENCTFQLQAGTVSSDAEVMAVWPTLSDDLRTKPMRTLATLGVAMHAAVSVAINDASLIQGETTKNIYVPRTRKTPKIYVRPEDFVPVDLITNITNEHVDLLYAVRGVVSMVCDLEYNIAWIAYKCSLCQTEQAMRQQGFYKAQPFHCKNTKCSAKKNFIEQRSSPYTRLCPKQVIRLEESNLQLLTDYDTILPGVLDIELRHDLVGTLSVGAEVVVTGILKMRDLNDGNQASTSAAALKQISNKSQIYMKAISIQNAKHVKRNFSDRDMEAIAMINGEADILKLLVQSLTPEVHGHEMAKAGCLLSLFGGAGSQICEKAIINVLLVGDVGIGKSKILKMCTQISERGAYVSGKRASLFGHKLAVTFDGRPKRNLQAGALVSANTGHCTIEDLDKLAAQQGLILQSMQSQEMNLPCSAIFATLSARTSIIASANPQRGHYDKARYLLQNVRIMPPLMREFHLAFVLLDQPNVDKDVSLTEHVRALHAGSKKSTHIAHRYALKPKTNDSITFGLDDDEQITADDQYYNLAKRLALNAIEEEEMDLLPPVLMKKFIAYARQSVQPFLNDEAADNIKEFYKNMRARAADENGRSRIGTGQLIGLIHLAQARARIDLSNEVTQAHVRDVIAIVTESMAQTSLGGDGDGVVDDAGFSSAGASKSATLKRFIAVMQQRSNALNRRIFDFDELKEIARRAGIQTGVTDLVNVANMQGYLLKKGVNMYEVLPE